MKNILRLCLPVLLFSFSNAHAQFQYVSPMPGSKMNNTEREIIIRQGSIIKAASLQDRLFKIYGSKSGNHVFKTTFCSDSKTILLHPLAPFAYDEQVTVAIGEGLQSGEGRKLNGYSFSFTTHRQYTPEEEERFRNAKAITWNREMQQYHHGSTTSDDGGTRDLSGLCTITTNNNPAPGNVFFDAFSALYVPNSWEGYHVIKSNGDSVYSHELHDASDFKMELNGNFGYRNGGQGRFEELDSNFNVISQIYGANGYGADFHEMQITPDHHVFIIADENQVVDMTVYNPNYVSNATVIGNVIQEFDPSGNVIFEWRSFDHVAIDEAVHIILSNSYIDYIHTNTIEIDYDGNLLLSHRHLDQITKIDINTGDFIWRMGGVMNEFTFTNDAEKFCFQHDIRRMANGNVTLWDNGNYHSPAHSTAKEYHLDEVNKTATLVWSYGHPGGEQGASTFYYAGGNAQRLSNGNTFINGGWHGSTPYSSMFEVTPGGTIVWEMSEDAGQLMTSYRAHKYVWDPCPRPTFTTLKTKSITATSAMLKWTGVVNVVKYRIQYKKHTDNTWIVTDVSKKKQQLAISGLTPNTKYDWKIETICDAAGVKVSGYTLVKTFKTLLQRVNLTADENLPLVSIFPNPAHNEVTIEAGGTLNEIRIVDFIGREVLHQKLDEQNEVSHLQVPLGNLPAGAYLVEITSNNQQQVKKLVIE